MKKKKKEEPIRLTLEIEFTTTDKNYTLPADGKISKSRLMEMIKNAMESNFANTSFRCDHGIRKYWGEGLLSLNVKENITQVTLKFVGI